jgi:hypothetical protein
VEAVVGGAWRGRWAARGGSGAGGRLSSPAPVSGGPVSHKDLIAFVIFVLDPIAFYFLFRDLIVFYFLFWYMIAFLFYIQGPIYKKFDSQVIKATKQHLTSTCLNQRGLPNMQAYLTSACLDAACIRRDSDFEPGYQTREIGIGWS